MAEGDAGGPRRASRGRPRIDEDKVIVRSNGTVTYTGKDIAYQLWKLGLLDRDFRYRRHRVDPDGHVLWTTTSGAGERGAPVFGHASAVYNVIDVGQSYPQRVVKAGVAALGHAEEAAAQPPPRLREGRPLARHRPRPRLRRVRRRSRGQGLGSQGPGRQGRRPAGRARSPRPSPRSRRATPSARPTAATGARDRDRDGRAALLPAQVRHAPRSSPSTWKRRWPSSARPAPTSRTRVVRARNIFAKLEAEGHAVAALRERAQGLDLEPLLGGEEGDEVWSLLLLLARSEEAAEQAVRAEEVALAGQARLRGRPGLPLLLPEAEATRSSTPRARTCEPSACWWWTPSSARWRRSWASWESRSRTGCDAARRSGSPSATTTKRRASISLRNDYVRAVESGGRSCR